MHFQSHALGRTTVLIIDEAQNLDMDVLEQLRMLTNLETDKHKLLKIVLIGQPELQEKLEHPEVAQIKQRITSRYHLSPLNRADAFAFIQHRLIIAGGGRMQFFTEKALQRVFQLSKGIPRLINTLCDRALLGAYVEETDQVTDRIMIRAAKEVLGEVEITREKQPRTPFLQIKTLLFVIIIIFFGTTVYLYSYGPTLSPVQQLINNLTNTPKNDNTTESPISHELSQAHSPPQTTDNHIKTNEQPKTKK